MRCVMKIGSAGGDKDTKAAREKASDLNQCPRRSDLSCLALIDRTKLLCGAAASKLGMNCRFEHIGKPICEPQCTAVSRKIEVQFQVSSCVKSEVPEMFLHHYFLHHLNVTTAKTP